MKNRYKYYILLLLSFNLSHCKSTKTISFETTLSKNIKFEYERKKRKSCKHICNYINVKIINTNNVGIYIPGVTDEFFLGIDINDKYNYIFDFVGEWADTCPNEYYDFVQEAEMKIYKTEEREKYYRDLVRNVVKREIKKYIVPKLHDSIKRSKEYDYNSRGLKTTIENYKYTITYFIPANSYIETMIYIEDKLDRDKKINKIYAKTDTKYILKKSTKNLKVPLGMFGDKLDNKYIKMPMTYPKKIGNYHLVRWVKSKDTIINLR